MTVPISLPPAPTAVRPPLGPARFEVRKVNGLLTGDSIGYFKSKCCNKSAVTMS